MRSSLVPRLSWVGREREPGRVRGSLVPRLSWVGREKEPGKVRSSLVPRLSWVGREREPGKVRGSLVPRLSWVGREREPGRVRSSLVPRLSWVGRDVVGPLSSMATPPHPHPPPLTALSPATPLHHVLCCYQDYLIQFTLLFNLVLHTLLLPTSPSLTHKYTDPCSPLWNDPVAVGYKPPGSMQSEQVRQFPHLLSKKKNFRVVKSEINCSMTTGIVLLSLMLKKKVFGEM